jgi:transposase
MVAKGPKAAKVAAKTGYWTVEIVERLSTAVGFEVLPKTLDRRRHLCLAQPVPPPSTRLRALRQAVAAFIHLAMIRIMRKRLVASSSS